MDGGDDITLIKTLEGRSGWAESVNFSPDGTMLASGSTDKTIKIWDVATGVCKETLHGHSGEVYSVSFSPDGTLLASGSSDKTIKIWDVATWTEIKTLRGHTGYVRSVSFSSDGTKLASGSFDSTIKIWKIESHIEKSKTDVLESEIPNPNIEKLKFFYSQIN